jgi:hypothetical protein
VTQTPRAVADDVLESTENPDDSRPRPSPAGAQKRQKSTGLNPFSSLLNRIRSKSKRIPARTAVARFGGSHDRGELYGRTAAFHPRRLRISGFPSAAGPSPLRRTARGRRDPRL